jgi:alkaline phosphatase
MKNKIVGVVLISSLLLSSMVQAQDKLSYTNKNFTQTILVDQVAGKKVKNVILMIGDGMGLPQVFTSWAANNGKLNFDNFKYTGFSRTTAAKKLITDSGASGTAMSSGEKTTYHAVGVDTAGVPLKPITAYAHEAGLSTGVIVTCGITDATPATFCANNIDRDQEEELATDFLNCNVDFIFGGGRSFFNKRSDKRDLLDEMKNKGYQIASTWQQANAIQSGKVLALIEEGQLPLANERGTLHQDATMLGIGILSKNKNGFFAMVEGSRIDDCGHSNDLPKLVEEVLDFDQTIGKVLQWAEKDGETLVIVVADHETGGLTLLDGDISKGYVKGHFSTGGHSGILVPVYAYGPQAEQFTGIYENTQIFHKIKTILKLK